MILVYETRFVVFFFFFNETSGAPARENKRTEYLVAGNLVTWRTKAGDGTHDHVRSRQPVASEILIGR